MRKAIGRMLRALRLDFLVRILRDTERFITRSRKSKFVVRQQVKKYLEQYDNRKLHVGCGSKILSGWLNSDYSPNSKDVLYLDVTKPFPIGDSEFDYIFSEHMIEHISYSQGSMMLSECFRILKDKGTIRISTPDLKFLIDLYSENKSNLQNEYIKWSTDNHIEYAHHYDETFVINHFIREFGHYFVYDEKTLRSSMEKAGFTHIKRCDINQSEHESLINLETVDRIPEEFFKLETFTLEGRKL
jgi:predicted SAM-dependent methyltransferase